MTEAEITEQLEAIRQARLAIYKTGTSYSRTGLQLTRASLPQLRDDERYLFRQLAKLRGNSSFVGDFR